MRFTEFEVVGIGNGVYREPVYLKNLSLPEALLLTRRQPRNMNNDVSKR